MAEKQTGDPKDRAEHVGGRRFVPVHGSYGVAAVMPGPVTAGAPKPEPEDERWTLAPGHRHGPGTDADEKHVEPVPVEPVMGTVTRPAAEDDEPEPT